MNEIGSMMLEKQARHLSENYLRLMRAGECAVRNGQCMGEVEAHHLSSIGARGSDPICGGSDYTAIGLCRAHHAEIHSVGVPTFEQKHSINVWKHAFRRFYDFLVRTQILPIGGLDE